MNYNGIDLKVKVVWVINYLLYSRLGMCVWYKKILVLILENIGFL